MPIKTQIQRREKAISKQRSSQQTTQNFGPIAHHKNTSAIIQRAQRDPRSLDQQEVHHLQSTIGNQAAQRMFDKSADSKAQGTSPYTTQSKPIQRQEELEEKEEVQMKADSTTLQLQETQEEEELQMKSDPTLLQKQEMEEEEPLQGKFEAVQRQSPEEEEEEVLQGKFTTSETPAQLQDDIGETENRTGMSRPLKAGLEALSGMDVSGIRVHKNSSKPAQLNALAYTKGQDIHVAPGQEKHIPHEGWHAVQQMQGRVKPTMQAKGASINDDKGLEREADVMGEKASRSQQVSYPPTEQADAAAESVVHRELAVDFLPAPQSGDLVATGTQHKPVQMYTKIAGKAYDLLADDGKMAVKDHSREAWAESSNILNSNKILGTLKSKAKIEQLAAGDIVVTPPGKAGTITLKKFRMVDPVTSSEAELTNDCGTANQEMLGADVAGYESFVGANKRGTTDEYTKPSKYEADDNAPGGLVSTTERISGEIYIRIFKREFKKTLNREDALKEWDKLSTADKNRLSKKYGINQFAVPKVGQGITIGSERDMPGGDAAAIVGGNNYNFHFGLNLMASGHDYITLEDYDSSGVKYYFDMYGPRSKSQTWAETSSNVEALGAKTTTMVVQHPESLKGIVNTSNTFFEADPGKPKYKKTLDKNTKVTIIRKGHSWMKVKVKSGARVGEYGWILNKFFTDN